MKAQSIPILRPRRAMVLPVVGVALLLSACSSGGSPRPSGPATAPRPYVSPIGDIRGLEGVIGQSPQSVMRQFGKPRLDVVEPYGRKLQFSGKSCVLDVYFYPDRQGSDRAVHVDARNHEGSAVDRAGCVSALR